MVDTHTETPWGSLSCEAALNFQTTKNRIPRSRYYELAP
jgi:hypothetical protein